MARDDSRAVVFVTALTISSGTWWTIWVGTGDASALIIALALHVSAATLFMHVVERARRPLAGALGLAIPIFGLVAALISARVRGRGGVDLLHDPSASTPRLDGIELARRLRASVPACDALASGNRELRRQAIAQLTGRAAPADIECLRWGRTLPGEASIEVAVAFEELGARFEQRAADARTAVAEAPSFVTHAALFTVIADGVARGVVDGALVGHAAAEGRRCHDEALACDVTRMRELVERRVRLALATHRAREALHLIATLPPLAGDLTMHAVLDDLVQQAAYAARFFHLTGHTDVTT